MLAFMLSPSGLISSGGGSDGESGLDLLRGEGSNSDESNRYWDLKMPLGGFGHMKTSLIFLGACGGACEARREVV
nr:hypothetical protein [Tanacetum cinerariifolium]